MYIIMFSYMVEQTYFRLSYTGVWCTYSLVVQQSDLATTAKYLNKALHVVLGIIVIWHCSLRDTAVQVAKKCFKDEWEEKRVEFLPVEWRTWLTLDKGTFNIAKSRLEQIWLIYSWYSTSSLSTFVLRLYLAPSQWVH